MKPGARALAAKDSRSRVALLAVLATLVTALWATGFLVPASGALANTPAPISIGSITLRSCKAVVLPQRQAWCGSIPRPMGVGGGRVKVGFTVVTPTGKDPRSLTGPPIVAMEGGPGYSSIDSAQGFAQMLGPVLDDRVLVVMDARGTGKSGAIDCPSLGPEGNGSVAACGRYLGARIGSYSSAAAADDLSALLGRLGLGTPILYGDSYGTFLAQVYAGRHPVAGLVLDGAYPVSGESAWFDTQGPALRKAIDLVCSRDTTCDPGRTMNRLEEVLDQVRRTSVRIKAPGADNRLHSVAIDAPALVGMVFNGTYLTPTMRELDAALGAALSGDWLPLGRLIAEFEYPGGDPLPAAMYSPGQALAVSCHDYPQLFSWSSSTAERRDAVLEAVDRKSRTDPDVYAPFTIREYLDSNWAEQETCVPWPLRSVAAGLRPASAAGFGDVPVLVISGDLDTITTAAEGQMVADSFPRAHHLIVENGLHVNALGSPNGCAAAVVRAFIVEPLIEQLPARCSLPPIQLAPAYTAQRGPTPVGEAISHTVADVLDRAWQSMGDRGRGLRGGRWKVRGWPDATIELQGVRLYEDLPVDGTIKWNVDTGAVVARLRVDGQAWSGCWQAQDGFGPGSTAITGDSCQAPAPTLAP